MSHLRASKNVRAGRLRFFIIGVTMTLVIAVGTLTIILTLARSGTLHSVEVLTPRNSITALEGLTLREVWRVRREDSWHLAALNRNGVTESVLVCDGSGSVVALDPRDGHPVRGISLDRDVRELITGDLDGDGSPEIIGYNDIWGKTVFAYSEKGRLLWRYPTEDGTDSACLADVNGDGKSEVVLGLNGSGGVRLLSGDGRQLWVNTESGNIWEVFAADIDNDGRDEIIHFDSNFNWFVRDGSGRLLQSLKSDGRSFAFLPVVLTRGRPVFLIGVQEGKSRSAVRCQEPGGRVLWEYDLGSSGPAMLFKIGHFRAGASETVIAICTETGQLHFIDQRGQLLSRAALEDSAAEAVVVSRGVAGQDLLVIAYQDEIVAYGLGGSVQAESGERGK